MAPVSSRFEGGGDSSGCAHFRRGRHSGRHHVRPSCIARHSLTAAREEIERWSGRQFDPSIVKLFMDMPANIWDDLRKEINSQIYRFTLDSGEDSE